jgi:hypothetical protein
MTDGEQERLIIGYGNLSKFLTERGFAITKSTLNRLGAEHRGPPVHGTWSNSYTFRPSDALQWARERSQQPRTPRGRKFAKPKPAAAAPVQVEKNDPPPPAPVVAASPPPQLGEALPPSNGRRA